MGSENEVCWVIMCAICCIYVGGSKNIKNMMCIWGVTSVFEYNICTACFLLQWSGCSGYRPGIVVAALGAENGSGAVAAVERPGIGAMATGTATADKSKGMGEMGVTVVEDKPGMGVAAVGESYGSGAAATASDKLGIGVTVAGVVVVDESKGMGAMGVVAAADRPGMGATVAGGADQSKGMGGIVLLF